MKKGKCSLITNHGIVLAFIARHPKPSTQEIAEETGLSVRGVSKIILNLKENGWLSWQREGRRNRYTVNLNNKSQQNFKREHARVALKQIDPILDEIFK